MSYSSAEKERTPKHTILCGFTKINSGLMSRCAGEAYLSHSGSNNLILLATVHCFCYAIHLLKAKCITSQWTKAGPAAARSAHPPADIGNPREVADCSHCRCVNEWVCGWVCVYVCVHWTLPSPFKIELFKGRCSVFCCFRADCILIGLPCLMQTYLESQDINKKWKEEVGWVPMKTVIVLTLPRDLYTNLFHQVLPGHWKYYWV